MDAVGVMHKWSPKGGQLITRDVKRILIDRRSFV